MIRNFKIIIPALAGAVALFLALYVHNVRIVPLPLEWKASNFVDHILLGYPAGLHTPYWMPVYNAAAWSFWATFAYGIATRATFGFLSFWRLVVVFLIGAVAFAAAGSLVVAGLLGDALFKNALPIVCFLAGIFVVRDWPAK